MYKKISISLFTFFILTFSYMGIVNAAGYTEHTITTSKTFDLQGNTSNVPIQGFLKLFEIYPELNANTTITSLKVRLKCDKSTGVGGDYFYLKIGGFIYRQPPEILYLNYKSSWGSYSEAKTLVAYEPSTLKSNAWSDYYTFNFDPNIDYRIISMYIPNFVDYNGAKSYKWSLEISQINYRKYSLDSKIDITPEKYIKITVTKPVAGIPAAVSIYNSTDNIYVVGNEKQGQHFTDNSIIFEFIDSSVIPGKTYIYNIKYTVGNEVYYYDWGYRYLTPINLGDVSIEVPSSETEARDAALAAKKFAYEAKVAAEEAKASIDAIKTIAEEAKAMASDAKIFAEKSSMKVFKVIANIRFEDFMYVEVNGKFGDYEKKSNDYVIANNTGGFTYVEGLFKTVSPSYRKIPVKRPDGTDTFILFKIIKEPSLEHVAIVNFS